VLVIPVAGLTVLEWIEPGVGDILWKITLGVTGLLLSPTIFYLLSEIPYLNKFLPDSNDFSIAPKSKELLAYQGNPNVIGVFSILDLKSEVWKRISTRYSDEYGKVFPVVTSELTMEAKLGLAGDLAQLDQKVLGLDTYSEWVDRLGLAEYVAQLDRELLELETDFEED